MGVAPVGVAVLGFLYPLEVSAIVLELGILHVLDGLCGIHTYCRTDSLAVTGVGPTFHELTVHIECQMVVQERGAQVHTGCQALVVAALQHTLLASITYTYTIGHGEDRLVLGLHATLHGDVVVVVNTCTVDFLLPVGIVCAKLLQGVAVCVALLPAEQVPCLAALAIVIGDEVHIFLCIHHVKSVEVGRE